MANSETFEIGDVVRLKSGGPQMCIVTTGSRGCQCEWFDGSDVKKHDFIFETLVKENPDDNEISAHVV